MYSTLEAISFSETLVKFCIEDQGMFWAFVPSVPPTDDTLDTVKDVANAVLNLIQQAKDTVTDCKKELEDLNCTSPSVFTRYALAAARFYFPKGYSHEAFLSYCSMVVGVVTMFFKDGKTLLAGCAAEVIGLVIIAHILTKKFLDHGGYCKLRVVSTAYSAAMKAAKKKKKKGV